jgi:type 1 glutamine amidotransferase
MGHDSRLWETTLRTDTENITKKDLKKGNFKNLNYFDVLVFASTTGEMDLTDDQKADMMSFIKEDGKGFVGIHAALDTNYKWPEYGEMIGGWFNEHPWGTFKAPIILEDPTFPAVKHFAAAFMKKDEIYQAKHTKEAWDDPDITKMYFEAIKWALGMTEGRTSSHASHY